MAAGRGLFPGPSKAAEIGLKPGKRKNMDEVFRLQRQLNAFTLKEIGLNYEETITHLELKPLWIENYRKALSAELAELIREVEEHGIGTQNGKVEMIDILHFLVSLSHIVGVHPHDLESELRILSSGIKAPLNPSREESRDLHPAASRAPADGKAFLPCAVKTFLCLDDLQNSLKWKWWAKGGGFKPEKARQAVIELWACFTEICAIFELDRHTLKKIYIAKNQVNFMRQHQQYNEDTKTEEDNRLLEVSR